MFKGWQEGEPVMLPGSAGEEEEACGLQVAAWRLSEFVNWAVGSLLTTARACRVGQWV